VARAVSTARTIYLALLASLAIYGGIAFQVAASAETVSAKSGTAASPESVRLLLISFALVSGIMTVFVIPLLRRLVLPAPGSGLDLDKVLGKLQTASIATWALAESIGIYGLILAFLSRDPLYYIGFAALAAVNFALYPPRTALWDEATRSL